MIAHHSLTLSVVITVLIVIAALLGSNHGHGGRLHRRSWPGASLHGEVEVAGVFTIDLRIWRDLMDRVLSQVKPHAESLVGSLLPLLCTQAWHPLSEFIRPIVVTICSDRRLGDCTCSVACSLPWQRGRSAELRHALAEQRGGLAHGAHDFAV